MTMPTLKQINDFIASIVVDMTEAELENWESLSDFERKSIAWSSWIVLHNAKGAA